MANLPLRPRLNWPVAPAQSTTPRRAGTSGPSTGTACTRGEPTASSRTAKNRHSKRLPRSWRCVSKPAAVFIPPPAGSVPGRSAPMGNQQLSPGPWGLQAVQSAQWQLNHARSNTPRTFPMIDAPRRRNLRAVKSRDLLFTALYSLVSLAFGGSRTIAITTFLLVYMPPISIDHLFGSTMPYLSLDQPPPMLGIARIRPVIPS